MSAEQKKRKKRNKNDKSLPPPDKPYIPFCPQVTQPAGGPIHGVGASSFS